MSAQWLRQIERKWQDAWEKAKLFEADPDPSRPKVFVTFPYPYPNGPLHVGHGFTSARLDAYARFKRMQGYNVLFPWAWHWTGEAVAGISHRVEKGDERLIKALREIDGVSEEDLKKFVDPLYVIKYYTERNRKVVRDFGLSVDWRREFYTTSLNEGYNRFITWQYTRLKEKGYVTKGTHPVVWCPRCQSPTGDHDRLVGVGVSPEEYVLIKFRMGDIVLPGATFRPETVYGVTNVWLNPEVTYVIAEVDGEKWLISRPCAEKLKNQGKEVKVLEEVKGASFMGKMCKEPIKNREIPILPATFVDPNNGTGVVYSVPSHAPYDWLALRDLKRDPSLLEKYGVPPEVVEQVEPISMIRLEGFGDHPAIEIVERMGIRDQHDPKAEEATKIIYKKEYHTGILKEICGEYAGYRVFEVKERIIRDFMEKGIADVMYDLVEPVVCRCGTPCIVKLLVDQWFLKYSDPEWKKLAREALSEIRVFPESARPWFEEVIEWLRDKACARKTGYGTPLPWDKEWIVETLSDSTIYMAYYTVSKFVNSGEVDPSKLTEEVFDFVFLGLGSAEEVSRKTGISADVLKRMREEFLYWYPVDLRISGKDLLPNHLTFFIFHHVALFPRELWPRGVCVGGILRIEGEEMSKSKGNFIPLRKAIEKYGADGTRLTLLLAAEEMDDPDWRERNAEESLRKLQELLSYVKRVSSSSFVEGESRIDRWLMSRSQLRAKKVADFMEQMKTRSALVEALFMHWNDFKYYERRSEAKTRIFLEVLKRWIRMLAPFIPHLAEEMWALIGEKELVSRQSWPSYDLSKIDYSALIAEEELSSLLEDLGNVLKVLKKTPKKICIYVASSQKWALFRTLLAERSLNKGEWMRKIASHPEFGKNKALLKLAPKMFDHFLSLSSELVDYLRKAKFDELEEMKESAEYISRKFGIPVEVYAEDDPNRYDPANRAGRALPLKPAFYVE